MSRLPLFPLGAVLFPGLVLPLTVFEERYRTLARHLRDLPDGTRREFGVVAIKRGWEVDTPGGGTASLTLHEVGCSAEVRQLTELADGRFELITVGRRRFLITEVDPTSAPYLTAEVTWLDEPAGEPGDADRLVPGLLDLFQRYLRVIRPNQPGEQLPGDPGVLSHLIAATTLLSLDERQALLAAADTASRLRAEQRLLRREMVLLQRLRAIPMPTAELGATTSPN